MMGKLLSLDEYRQRKAEVTMPTIQITGLRNTPIYNGMPPIALMGILDDNGNPVPVEWVWRDGHREPFA